MNIISWNVNGLRAVMKKGFVDFLKKDKPDILCIQETKLSEESQIPAKLKEPNGYHSYWSLASTKKGYSGVAVFTKLEPRKVSYGFGIEKFDKEGRIIVAEYDDFVLMNIYFPNGKMSEARLNYKMDFYDAFLEFSNKLKKQGKKIIVCGDYNTAHKEIDIARPRENEKKSGFLPSERAWIDKYISNGYVDIFREFHPEPNQYTYWDMRTGARARNIGWRIDYFFVSDNAVKKIKDAFILPKVHGSDHCPLGIEL